MHTKNHGELDIEKIHLAKSLELTSLLKVEALAMSSNIIALKQAFCMELSNEAPLVSNEDDDGFYKLQVFLLSAWNAMIQNRLFLISSFKCLRPSLLFPMDSNVLIKSLQHSRFDDLTLKQKLLLKIHDVNQDKVVRYVYEQLQAIEHKAIEASEAAVKLGNLYFSFFYQYYNKMSFY
jgi:hypothetical protein